MAAAAAATATTTAAAAAAPPTQNGIAPAPTQRGFDPMNQFLGIPAYQTQNVAMTPQMQAQQQRVGAVKATMNPQQAQMQMRMQQQQQQQQMMQNMYNTQMGYQTNAAYRTNAGNTHKIPYFSLPSPFLLKQPKSSSISPSNQSLPPLQPPPKKHNHTNTQVTTTCNSSL